MPGAYRINITEEAPADLQSIFDHIGQHSSENAARMVQQLLDEIDGLTTMASRYQVVGRSRKRGSAVHSMVVRPYIVY
jgi:plasmid stabilization system protein ParE